MSSGHTTPGLSVSGRQCPFRKYDDFARHNCSNIVLTRKGPSPIKSRIYPGRVDQTWMTCNAHLQTRQCDTLVNIDILRGNLDQLMNEALCKSASGGV